MKFLFKIPLLCLFLFTSLNAQFNENKFGVSLNLVYTTSAEIYLNPNSSDVEIRNRSYEFSDIINPALDFRYRLAKDVLLGIDIEYIRKTESAPNLTVFIGSQIVTIDVEDGFSFIPVEVSAYYILPFSNEEFIFLMGGGLGYYRGEFIRKVVNAELSLTSRQVAIGIHVSTSMDYMVLDNISLRFEMKFRNPQYNVTTKYTETEITYQGNVIQLPDDEFETKIDVNGITFVLGLAFHF